MLLHCVILVCLVKSAYLRNRARHTEGVKQYATLPRRMIYVVVIRVRSQPDHKHVLVRHIRVTTELALRKGVRKHVESICGL